MGIAPPPEVPMVYVVPAELLTTEGGIDVASEATSGEVEVYFVESEDGLLVGVGSDHTDREEEARDIEASKVLCAKVISRDVWRYEDVGGRWDELELRSWVTDDAGQRLYQEGKLTSFLRLDEIMAEVLRAGYELTNRLVFCGTLPAIGGLSYGKRFQGELRDAEAERTLGFAYNVGGTE
jgi:hypothetical protein